MAAQRLLQIIPTYVFVDTYLMKQLMLTIAVVAVSSTATNHRASAQHFDIFLARPAIGTATVIGGADVDGVAYDDVTRIFEVELATAGGEYLAIEPGVNHPHISNSSLTAYPSSAAPLQLGDVLRLLPRTFTIGSETSDLFFWNGQGAASFAPAAANFRIDGGDPLGSVAGVGGVFDDHPFLVVDSAALPGIYVASAVGVVEGFAPSEPVYFVMGTEDLISADFLGLTPAEFDMLSDDELDEALEGVIEQGVAYVETNVVPEPTAMAMLGGAALAVLRTVRTHATGRRAEFVL
jgi:hypothetical protein